MVELLLDEHFILQLQVTKVQGLKLRNCMLALVVARAGTGRPIWDLDSNYVWFLEMIRMIQYSSGGFSKSPPPSPRTGGVDFFNPPWIFLIPHSNSHLDGFSVRCVSAEFPLQNHPLYLPVELRGGQKFIMASSQWKISDVRMIDSSEFFRVCMGRKSEPLFCLRIIRLICHWINTEIFVPRD